MKREFLENYGLAKEQIDEILNENGNDINKVKADAETLKTQVEEYKEQLTKRDADIAELSKQTGNSAELQSKLNDLQAKYEADTQALNDKVAETTRNSAIELALTKAGAKNIKAAKALLDLDKLEVGEDGVKGLGEQLTAMQESDGYLFGSGESTGQLTSTGNPTGTGNFTVTKDQFDGMSYAERAELAQKQPEVFKTLTGGI